VLGVQVAVPVVDVRGDDGGRVDADPRVVTDVDLRVGGGGREEVEAAEAQRQDEREEEDYR